MLHTFTWECEEFTLRTVGREDYGLVNVCADIEDDGSDWTVARVGLLGGYRNGSFEHVWLSKDDPLVPVLTARIYERYQSEVDEFLRLELEAA